MGDEDKRDEGDEDVMGLRLGKRRSSEFGGRGRANKLINPFHEECISLNSSSRL